ncbi:hypothetical protein OG599_35035 (plasmid) [Streptomyces sp. NBC_01335]|uniref:hypothetical protein n=1 Tax=Streptomyces sp. NBC_01335 TaxID=2903828 RepID=UPI002E0EDA2A|nr:hypothetical protein OG599_35035 [Streptomyces sp. NBC_01335]
MLQPVPTFPNPLPTSPGCVITPGAARGFGFRKTLRWVRKIVIIAVIIFATAGLAWMWHAGHEAEVAGELLVAALIGAVTAAYGSLKGAFRPGGELAWR